MTKKNFKITFCGGAGAVTGACYLVEAGDSKILVDCGMIQGSRFSESLNDNPFPFDPKAIDAVLITHAHIDHTGRLPKLARAGFKGKILATAPTIDFSRALLLDSEHVIRMEAEHEGREPLYNIKDVERVFDFTESVPYDQYTVLNDNISFFLRDAGHILGSVIIELFLKDGDKKIKIVFSGDLGNSPSPLVRDPFIVKDADYLLIESTYGNKLHPTDGARKDLLEDVIEETIAAGGVLMIPAFATERTQELLYELNELMENGRIPKVPVFIDSPLAIKITEIYKKYPQLYDKEAKELLKLGDEIFHFPGLRFTPGVEDSRSINAVRPPKIIIAGSGMSQGGRILYHEKLYLPDEKSTLLIIGYQVKGSLGRKLLDGEPTVKIHGAEVEARAKVVQIAGYSAHADQKQLLAWVDPMRHSLKKVFVVQGEAEASRTLAQIIADQMAIPTVVPAEGEGFILE